MKVAIVGAGSIGSLWGAYLTLGGADVTLVECNPALIAQIQSAGLIVRGVRGEHRVPIKIAHDYTDSSPPELVMLCVKAYDTEKALAQHAGLFAEAGMALTMQNGLGNAEAIARHCGAAKVLAGTTTMGANLVQPGMINHAGEGETYLGEIRGGTSERIRRLAATWTAAGIPTRVSDNITALIWNKLAVNVAINALTALLRVRNGVLLEHDATRELMRAAVDETVAVAAGLDIGLDGVALRERAAEVARLTAANRSSMLMDVLSDKPTEIEFINGAIARLGRENGIPTPVNEVLTKLLSAVERTASRREQ